MSTGPTGTGPTRTAPVSRVAAVVRLRPGAQEEYRRLHTAVPPDVVAAMRAAHIGNFSVFVRDGTLFQYYEYAGADLAADLEALSRDEASRRWWRLTEPCQQAVPTAAPGELWAPAEELFHAD